MPLADSLSWSHHEGQIRALGGTTRCGAHFASEFNRFTLTVRRSLPVFPCDQTFRCCVGMSERCQEPTFMGMSETKSLKEVPYLRCQ
jgi:hypothetical protein